MVVFLVVLCGLNFVVRLGHECLMAVVKYYLDMFGALRGAIRIGSVVYRTDELGNAADVTGPSFTGYNSRPMDFHVVEVGYRLNLFVPIGLVFRDEMARSRAERLVITFCLAVFL